MSVQTLKSAVESRVRNDYAEWGAFSRLAGHHYETCPAGSSSLMNDEYGRPVNQNTLDMRSAECNAHAPHPHQVSNHIQRENNERPYMPIAHAGMRGAGDFMGVGRDLMPQDLYGNGTRGNFVRYSRYGSELPQPESHVTMPPAERRVHAGLPSMDATSPYSYRG